MGAQAPIMAIVGYGFIGRRIARSATLAGWRVRALTHDRETNAEDGVELVFGDAGDPAIIDSLVRGAEHVVYAAGTAKPAESNDDPIVDAVTNLRPLISTLHAVACSGVASLTFLSSGGTVYGPDAPVPTAEDAPLWPVSSYGVLKVAAERYVAMYARNHAFTAEILRCANVFGPGEPTSGSQGLIGIVRERMRSGKSITLYGDGSALRDFVHVDDLGDVIVQLRDHPGDAGEARVFNVGSGRAVSVAEIVDAVARSLGVEPRIEQRPMREGDVPSVQLDISRIQKITGFVPRDVLRSIAGVAEQVPER